jgi:capsular exopolysaccharide synthesis family protein
MSMKFKSADRSAGQILAVFWQRKFLIVLIAFTFALLGLAIARQMTPTYTADGSLVMETQQLTVPNVRTFDNQFQAVPGDPGSVVRTQMLVLRSRALTEQIVQELELDRLPEFNPSLRAPGLLTRIRGLAPERAVQFLDSAGVRLPEAERPPATPEEAREAVLQIFQRNLEVASDGRSFIINVGFTSQNPEIAARVVNRLMESYLAAQLAAKLRATTEASAVLGQQLEQARQDMEEADRRVQEHRRRYGFFDSRLGTVLAQSVVELNTTLAQAQAALAVAEARYTQAQRASREGNAAALAEVLNAPSMPLLRQQESELARQDAELAARLGPNHPQRNSINQQYQRIRQQIQAEVNRGLQAASNDVQRERTRVAQLQAQLRTREASASTNAEAEAQLQVMQRDAEAKRNIFNNLQQTAQQTAQGARSNQADARIVTSGVPPVFPASPRTGLIVGVAGIVGFLIGAAIAMILAELDRGFERTEELEAFTGLTALGVVPVVRWPRSVSNLSEYVIRNPASAVAETMRGFREALRPADGSPTNKIVLITSSSAGEGKTSLSSSLSRLHARDGEKVLLIEADFRRPVAMTIFTEADRDDGPTFEDALAGRAHWRDAVRIDPASSLRLLTASRPTNSPQAMLSSAVWTDLLAQASAEFDMIIIDSPPVLSVTDTLVLARHAQIVLIVVGWRSTQRRMLEATLKRLKRTGRSIGGVVLSKVHGYVEPEQYYAGYASNTEYKQTRRRSKRTDAKVGAPRPARTRMPVDPDEAGAPARTGSDRVVSLPSRHSSAG